MDKVKIDLIIPTYKPGEKFKKLLHMMSIQTMEVNKIIIVNTEEKYFRYKFRGNKICVKHIRALDFDHGNSRNLGVSISDADYFIMMTQDAVPYDEFFVEKLYSAINREEDIAAAYGRQLANIDASDSEKYQRNYNYPDKTFIKSKRDIGKLGIKTFFMSDVATIYRRDVFNKLGGFQKKAIFNEDMIYAYKAIMEGFKICYAGDAMVYHSHNYTAIMQFRRNFDLGVSQAQHPEIFEIVSSEKEGIKMIKGNIKYLLKRAKFYLVPDLIIKTGAKYLGYKLGKSYKKLPRKIVYKISMNKNYWKTGGEG